MMFGAPRVADSAAIQAYLANMRERPAFKRTIGADAPVAA